MFQDRRDAGRALAELLEARVGPEARLLAIPAGGVPVAIALGEATGLRVGVAVVSKVTLPWNQEAGYGAVAFDGTVNLNHVLIAELDLDEDTVHASVAATREKVARRVLSFPEANDLSGLEAVLVDDGLASGFTMRTAVDAVRKAGAARISVAVPTGSARAIEDLESRVDDVFCANVRTGTRFAVAEAYEVWSDVPELEAVELLRRGE